MKKHTQIESYTREDFEIEKREKPEWADVEWADVDPAREASRKDAIFERLEAEEEYYTPQGCDDAYYDYD